MPNKELNNTVDKIDEVVHKIMDWHYEACSINFGADEYIQDATDVIKIVKEAIKQREQEIIAKVEKINVSGGGSGRRLKLELLSYLKRRII